MTFNNDMTWELLDYEAGTAAREMRNALNKGLDAYNEWQSFRAGRTNAEIAAALGRTETEVAEMDACHGACKEMYDYANNAGGQYQGDRFYSLRKFS